MENLLNALFTQNCIGCNSQGALVCRHCLESCSFLERSNYLLNRAGGAQKLKVFSTMEYEGLIRQIILRSKYSRKEFMALKIASEFCANYAKNLGISYAGFTAVPIPLNPRKHRSRGFNQAEVIAQRVSSAFGIPTNVKILARSADTKKQYELNRYERLKNVEGAFDVTENVRGKKILLVDDICTTGATLSESARVLYLKGAKEVQAFTISRSSL